MAPPTPNAAAPPAPPTPVGAAPVGAPRPPRAIGRLHRRGMATLIGRELVVWVRFWPISIGGPAATSALFLAVFSLAIGPARQTAEGAEVIPFMAPGLIALALLQRAAETTTFSLMLRKLEGTIGELLVTPFVAGELAASFLIAGTLAALGTGAVVGVVVWLWTGTGIAQPLVLLAFAAGGAGLMASFGAIVGLWADKWDHVAAVYTFLIVPIAFLSGVFAPVTDLARPIELAVRANPIYYAIDGLRAGWLGPDTATAPLALSAAVVVATNVAMWLAVRRLFAVGYKIRA